jgi:hypothetical protein
MIRTLRIAAAFGFASVLGNESDLCDGEPVLHPPPGVADPYSMQSMYENLQIVDEQLLSYEPSASEISVSIGSQMYRRIYGHPQELTSSEEE